MNRLQGLGAPIEIIAPSAQNTIDPTLDACCQREILTNRKANALDQTLQANQHLLLQQERMRRNLVNTLKFSGCRCCYDPDNDGTGDYKALQELLLQRMEQDYNVNEDYATEVQRTVEDFDDDYKESVSNYEKNKSIDSKSDDDDSEYDYLLDDDLNTNTHDVELQRIQANRLAQLQIQLLQQQNLQQHGYGVHRQMHPTRVLRAAGLGNGERNYYGGDDDLVVLHLYDPESVTCAELDLYLEQTVAPKHPGTRFLRCGGRSCLFMDADLASKTLRRLQADRDIPALIAIKEGVMTACCPGLAGLYDSDGILVTRQVDEWLDRAGVLSTVPPQDVCRIRPEEDALMEYLVYQKNTETRENETIFQCGVAGCEKAFYHEHVGIETEHQSGLVIQESELLGE
jgi:hypothetical protein